MEMEDGQKVCLAGCQLRLGSILFRALEPSNQSQASAKSANQPRGNCGQCGSSLAAAESWLYLGEA